MSRPDEPTRVHVPLLRRREIEAQVIAPLIAEVRAEIGEERAVALLRRVIERLARESGAELARQFGESSLEAFADVLDLWTEGGALEIDLLERSAERLDFNVTRCRYAELYRSLGLAELGASLSCCRDAALAEGFDPAIELTRTQTIMEGAPHCDFRFRRRPGESR